MAFLCPVRIRRNKKKKPLDDESLQGVVPSMGRITGSASIETLVRVGIEKENGLGPESKMVVLHDFTPCVDDELEVKRGQIVHVLYQENDWVYVISEDNHEGFIPHSYCAQYGSQLATLALNVKKKLPRGGGNPDMSLAPTSMSMSPTRVTPPTSSMSSTAFANIMQHHQQQQQQQKPVFNNPPDVLVNASQNPGDKMGATNLTTSTDGHNLTITTTVTSHSGGGKVNPGMDHSDTDSFHEVRQMGPRSQNNDQSRSNSLMSETSSQPDIHPFYKDPSGRYVVLYSYAAQDENDLSVERGQCVTVLNTDDPDWFWVRRYDQQEGFVPSGFIYPLDAIQRQQGFSSGTMTAPQIPPSYNQMVPHHYPSPGIHPQQHPQQFGTLTSSTPSSRQISTHNTTWNGGSAGSSGPPSFTNPQQQQHSFESRVPNSMSTVTTNSFAGDLVQSAHKGIRPPSSLGGATSQGPPSINVPPGPPSQNGLPSADLCYNGTELVVLYDYKAQAPDDLTVRRGDWVYADLNNQTVDGWLWTYAPKTRKYGFIPKAYAKPPAMTSL